jgi:hypothetical protein
MKGRRFKAAMRSVLDYASAGLMWMGLVWIVPSCVDSNIDVTESIHARRNRDLAA